MSINWHTLYAWLQCTVWPSWIGARYPQHVRWVDDYILKRIENANNR